jgi:hypothetical protein
LPTVIDYERVTAQLTAQGLECLYYNSGAFGFARGVATHPVGWIGPPDPTIRPAALEFARTIPPPYESNLAVLARRAWREQLAAAPAWVMPKSHWHFELEFGSRAWMSALLEQVGVRPGDLEHRNNGAALEFTPDEGERFQAFVEGLLTNLAGSDFNVAWPGRAVVCTLHHHKQLWWITTDDTLAGALRNLPSAESR